MTVPTGYTEATFKAYLHAVAGDVATALGWTVDGGSYDEPLYDTLFAYGVSDIANATDIRKLRALGRVEVWHSALRDTGARYDFSADGGNYKRSQLHAMCEANYEAALTEALPHSDAYQVTVNQVVYDDYYTPPDLEEYDDTV